MILEKDKVPFFSELRKTKMVIRKNDIEIIFTHVLMDTINSLGYDTDEYLVNKI